ncbi:hypothetical protein GUITHDRAFT_102775 [Guillardia theta CCMP2712]|uniref:Calmodulin-lysine N-methyltransferase n=2 Tax=Guillardia theta TaxID=55529 RepID=L1JSU3_GUITC|nr:hypothetical protein GUITHDRAFT_102775 [Guillardia theta CCMP2712]EKX51512.1 hypothetical protein GUITHDRAFT_102775 [Guillardia theta CCMP2712]|eukprot:XP_005838492.1 hypothetical protein GUITHDRAFT_102775 [Guillardia theta CCMP2712]
MKFGVPILSFAFFCTPLALCWQPAPLWSSTNSRLFTFKKSVRRDACITFIRSSLESSSALKHIDQIVKAVPVQPRAVYFYDFLEDGRSSFSEKNWMMEVEDKEFSNEEAGRWESFFLKDVGVVRTRKSHPADGGLGHVVWNSARVLSALLLNEDSDMKTNFDGKRVLELGAGAGLMGLSIARKHPEASVDLTDYLPCLVDNIREVSERESMENIDAWVLDWKNGLIPEWIPPRTCYDVIIATDCIYHHIPADFTATVLKFIEHNPNARILISSPSNRNGIPLVVDRLQMIEDRQVEVRQLQMIGYQVIPAVSEDASDIRFKKFVDHSNFTLIDIQ